MARKSRKNIESAPVQAVQKPLFSAGAYLRLSVVDRKNKGESLDNQQAIIDAFVSGRDDIEIKESYIDNGFSGQSFERPAFLRMIADMESGKINCCITKDLSRLGRNAIDSGYYLERHFPSLGVRYIAVNDGYDSADGQSGGIIISLKNMINEAYALDVSRKVRATIQMNIKNGKFIGSSAPFGYFKSGEDCHQLVIDEYAAPVVRLMFEMAAAGERHQTILAWLNDNRIMPPRRYFNSIGLASDNEVGALTDWWSLRGVRDVLSNKVYYGLLAQGRSRVVGGVQMDMPESEWTVTENAHEAIVSRELYETVQKSWIRRNVTDKPYYKGPNTENIFAHKLFCAQCGHAIIRKRSGDNFYKYLCNTGIHYTKDACGGVKITETAMKETMLDMLRRYEPYLQQALSPEGDTVVATGAHADNGFQSELAAAQSELDRNRRYLEGLYESLVSGDISDAEYKDMKAAYEAKVASLAARTKGLREEIQKRARLESSLSQAHASVRTITAISDLTAEMIDRLIERIVVYPDGRIYVKFSFLDEAVYNMEGDGDE